MRYLRLVGNRWNVFVVSASLLQQQSNSSHWMKELSETGLPVVGIISCMSFLYGTLVKELLILQWLKQAPIKISDSKWRLSHLLKTSYYDPSIVPIRGNIRCVLPLLYRDLQEGLSECVFPVTKFALRHGRNRKIDFEFIISYINTLGSTTTKGFGTSKHKTMELCQILTWIVFPIVIYQLQGKSVVASRTPKRVRQLLEFTHRLQKHPFLEVNGIDNHINSGLYEDSQDTQKEVQRTALTSFLLSNNLALQSQTLGVDWQTDDLSNILAESTTTLGLEEHLDMASVIKKQISDTKTLGDVFPPESLIGDYDITRSTYHKTLSNSDDNHSEVLEKITPFVTVPNWDDKHITPKHFLHTNTKRSFYTNDIILRPDSDWNRIVELAKYRAWRTFQGDASQASRLALGWRVSPSILSLTSGLISTSTWIKDDFWKSIAVIPNEVKVPTISFLNRHGSHPKANKLGVGANIPILYTNNTNLSLSTEALCTRILANLYNQSILVGPRQYVGTNKACLTTIIRGLTGGEVMVNSCWKVITGRTEKTKTYFDYIKSELDTVWGINKTRVKLKVHWVKLKQECNLLTKTGQQWIKSWTNSGSKVVYKHWIPLISSNKRMWSLIDILNLLSQTVDWAILSTYKSKSEIDHTQHQPLLNTLLVSPTKQTCWVVSPSSAISTFANKSAILASMLTDHSDLNALTKNDELNELAYSIVTVPKSQLSAKIKNLANRWNSRWVTSVLYPSKMQPSHFYESTDTLSSPSKKDALYGWSILNHRARGAVRRSTSWAIEMLHTRRLVVSTALWKTVRVSPKQVKSYKMGWHIEAIPMGSKPTPFPIVPRRAAWRAAKQATVGKTVIALYSDKESKPFARSARAALQKLKRYGGVKKARSTKFLTFQTFVSMPISMQAVWAAKLDKVQKMAIAATEQALQRRTGQDDNKRLSTIHGVNKLIPIPLFHISHKEVRAAKMHRMGKMKLVKYPEPNSKLQLATSQTNLSNNGIVTASHSNLLTATDVIQASLMAEPQRGTEASILLQAQILTRHRNLILTQSWWFMAAKLAKQAWPIVFQVIFNTSSHALDQVTRLTFNFVSKPEPSSNNPALHTKQPVNGSELLNTLETIPVDCEEDPWGIIFHSYGFIKRLGPLEYVAFVSLGFAGLGFWLLYSLVFSSVSGIVYLALWNDFLKVRSSKQPSLLLQEQWLDFGRVWYPWQHEDEEQNNVIENSLNETPDTPTVQDPSSPLVAISSQELVFHSFQWWNQVLTVLNRVFKWQTVSKLVEIPIADVCPEKKEFVAQSLLGEEALLGYQLQKSKRPIQALTRVAWNDPISQSSLLTQNGLTYLRHWAQTAYAKWNCHLIQTGVPDTTAWINLILHKITVSSDNLSSKLLAGRRIPLELCSTRSRGILLLGTVDTGKAYLAKSLAAEGQTPLVHIAFADLAYIVDPWLVPTDIVSTAWTTLNRTKEKANNKQQRNKRIWFRTYKLIKLLQLSQRLAPSIVWVSGLDELCTKMNLGWRARNVKFLFKVFVKCIYTMYHTDLNRGVTLVGSSISPAKLDPTLVSLTAFQRIVHVRKPTSLERQVELLDLLNRKNLAVEALGLSGLQTLEQQTVGYTVRDLVALSQEILLISVQRGVQMVDIGTLSLALSRQTWGMHSAIDIRINVPQLGVILYKIGRAMVQRMLIDLSPMQPIQANHDVWKTRYYYFTKVHLEPSLLLSSLTELTVLPYVLSCLAGTAAQDAWFLSTRGQNVQKHTLGLYYQANHDLTLAASLFQFIFSEFAGLDLLHEVANKHISSLSECDTKPSNTQLKQSSELDHLSKQHNQLETGWIQGFLNGGTRAQVTFNTITYSLSWSTKPWRLGLKRSNVFNWYQRPEELRLSSFILPGYEEAHAVQFEREREVQGFSEKYDQPVSQLQQQEASTLQARLERMLAEQRMDILDLPVTYEYPMEHEIFYNSRVWLGEKALWDPLRIDRAGYQPFLLRDLLVTDDMVKILSKIYVPLKRHKTPFPLIPKKSPSLPLTDSKDATQRNSKVLKLLEESKRRVRFAKFRNLTETAASFSGPEVIRQAAVTQTLTLQRSHEMVDRFNFLKYSNCQSPDSAISAELLVYAPLLESYSYLLSFFMSNRSLLNEAKKSLLKQRVLY